MSAETSGKSFAQAHASPNPRSGLPYTDQSCCCERNTVHKLQDTTINVHAQYLPSGMESRRNRPDTEQVEPVSQTPNQIGFRTGKRSKISLFSKWTRTTGRLWRLEMDPAEEENATRILRLCVIAVSFLPLNSSLPAVNISHSRPICEKTKIVLSNPPARLVK